MEDNWDDLSPQLLSYPRSRTDLTKRITKFYLSGKDFEFSDSNSSTTLSTLPPAHVMHAQALAMPSHISSLNRNTGPVPHTIHSPTTQPTTTPPTTTSRHSIYSDSDDDTTISFEEQFKSFTNLFTDRFFAWPLFETIRLQASSSRIYAYENHYEGQHTMLDVYTGKSKEPAPAMKKVKNWFKTNILGRKVEAPKHLGREMTYS